MIVFLFVDAEDKVHTIVGLAILGTTFCMCCVMVAGAFLFYKWYVELASPSSYMASYKPVTNLHRHKKDEFKEVQHSYYKIFAEVCT